MFTAEEPAELERLIADMRAVNCTVTVTKTLIWVSGNTYPIKDSLKKAGWKWSGKKRAWWMNYDRYTGQNSEQITPDSGADHAIVGTSSDGALVVVAECHHESII